MHSIHIRNLIEIFAFAGISFLFATVIFPPFIRFVTKFKLTQKIKQEGLSGGASKLFSALHAHKAGTPTMGGAVIIFSILATIGVSRALAYFGILDHSILNRGETYLPIVTLAAVGILGLIDDYLNIK